MYCIPTHRKRARFGKSLINTPKSCIIYRVFFRILQPGYFLGMCKEAYSMECKIKNDYGTIYIAEDVMLKVVGYAALECYGIVAMSGTFGYELNPEKLSEQEKEEIRAQIARRAEVAELIHSGKYYRLRNLISIILRCN